MRRSSKCSEATRSRGHEVTRSRGHEVTRSRGHEVTRSRGHEVTSRGHEVTRSRGHEVRIAYLAIQSRTVQESAPVSFPVDKCIPSNPRTLDKMSHETRRCNISRGTSPVSSRQRFRMRILSPVMVSNFPGWGCSDTTFRSRPAARQSRGRRRTGWSAEG
ncbi:hypothetical protein E3T33_12120 [Cryobacterium sp. TMT1-2-1]|nr:hypothetical protein E3T33_12120 [Cryobacterium sp. TMT1-2-1]